MRIRVFASGSAGNSLAFRVADGSLYLVDLGLSCRELTTRMKMCGLDPAEIRGVFFTHDHSDHCKGVTTFHKKYPSARFYANGNTADAISTLTKIEDWSLFETAEAFDLDALNVRSFSIPHDAADPVGYLFEDHESALFVGTDMGVATLPVKDALAHATCAVLESNHDPVLLQTSDRPFSLKQRIAGRSGHLANADAAALVREVNPPRLKTLLLAHLSQACNTSSLALASMRSALAERGRADVTVAALEQNEPSAVYEF